MGLSSATSEALALDSTSVKVHPDGTGVIGAAWWVSLTLA